MSETNWIALSERKPTDEDADDNGYLWANVLGYTCARLNYWEELDKNAIAFHPIPKRVVPPLPKLEAETKRGKDVEKYEELNERNTSYKDDIHDFAEWARAEERKRFTAECLAICKLDQVALLLDQYDYRETPRAVRALHKLLTEAAKKP